MAKLEFNPLKVTSNFINHKANDLKKIADKLSKGDISGAVGEVLDTTSIGDNVTDAMASVGLLPDEGPGKEILSSLLNIGSGGLHGLVAGFKDLNDASMEIGKKGKKAHIKGHSVTTAHTPRRARAHYQKVIHHHHHHYHTEIHHHHHYHTEIHHHHHHHGRSVLDNMLRGVGKISLPKLGRILLPLPICLPPICQPPRLDIAIFPPRMYTPLPFLPQPGVSKGDMKKIVGEIVDDAFKQAIKNGDLIPAQTPVMQKEKPSSSSVSDIMSDPSLSFEDKIFLIMSKIMDEQEAKILKMADNMAKKLDQAEKKKAGGVTGTSASSSPTKADAASASNKMQKAVKSGGSDGGFFGQLKEGFGFIKPFLGPILKALSPMLTAIPGVGPLAALAAPFVIDPALDMIGQGLNMMANPTGGAPAGGGIQGQSANSTGGAQASSGTAAAGKTSSGEPGDVAEGTNKMKQDMEKIKMAMQKMTQMQQMLSNMMNMMHKTAMNTVSNIR